MVVMLIVIIHIAMCMAFSYLLRYPFHGVASTPELATR